MLVRTKYFIRLSVLAALVLMPFIAAPEANAHARLLASQPAEDEVLADSPTRLELTFSAGVEAQPDAVTLFGPNNADIVPKVESNAPSSSLVVPIDEKLAHGTWAFAYRVTSVDGHAITGSVTFSVGAKDDSAGVEERSQSEASTPHWVTISFAAARGLLFTGVLTLIGGGLFSLLVAPEWRPRLLGWATLLAFVSALAAFLLDAAWQLGLDAGDVLATDALRAESGTPFGRAMMVLGVALLFTLVPTMMARGHRPPTGATRWLLAPTYIVLAAALTLSGHAIQNGPVTVRTALDTLHVIAAAFWLGSLVQLGSMARDGDIHAEAVTRFSRFAVVAVMVLIVTGIYATWSEASLSVSTLLESRYGHLIAAKVALLAVIAPLAMLNKSTFVPALHGHSPDAARLLRAYTLRELALVLAVIAITAWLVLTPPPA